MEQIKSKTPSQVKVALLLIMAIFFQCGFITVLNSVLNPYFQNTLQLSYTAVVMIQVVFYTAYLIVSPIAGYLFRERYLIGIRLGLFIGVVGMGLMALAALVNSYPFVLMAIFVQGSAISMLQVTANPYVFQLGTPQSAASRFLFAQAFTSVGMVVAPYFGAVWILSQVNQEQSALPIPYLIQGGIWLTFFIFVFVTRLPSRSSEHTFQDTVHPLRDKHVLVGMLAISMCVGVETTVASFMIQYLADPFITGFPLVMAGKLTVLFWIGFMLGRFAGSGLLRYISQERLLFYHGVAGVLLTFIVITGSGIFATCAVLALGVCVSNVFPLVFSMVLSKARCCKTQTSGYLCMANIGGALFPFLQGVVADRIGLQPSFAVPAVCFLLFIGYAQYSTKSSVEVCAERKI